VTAAPGRAATVDQALAPPKVLLLAVGNPDRGDDGVGILVAQELRGRLPADVTLLARSGDMLSLIEDWAGFDVLLCVGAAAPATGCMTTPGRIHRFDLASDALPRELAFTSSHAFGLAEAIALARVLERAPPTIIVYAVEGGCFEGGSALTPEVASAAGVTADRVLAEIEAIRGRARDRQPRAGAVLTPSPPPAHP
jgi:hydrogenase maturation protease